MLATTCITQEIFEAFLKCPRKSHSSQRTSIARIKRGTHSQEHPAVSWGNDLAGYHSCPEAISRQRAEKQDRSCHREVVSRNRLRIGSNDEDDRCGNGCGWLIAAEYGYCRSPSWRTGCSFSSSPFLKVEFGIIRLAHRSLSPLGESFVRLQLAVDAEVLEFEEENAPKLIARQTPLASG